MYRLYLRLDDTAILKQWNVSNEHLAKSVKILKMQTQSRILLQGIKRSARAESSVIGPMSSVM